MTCWIVIPVKAPDACKTRLRSVLDDDARRTLVARMLHHVVATAQATPGVDEVLLLGPSRHGLPASIRQIDDPGLGLNLALAAATRAAAAAGAARLTFVSADLPLVTPADLQSLIALPAAGAAIAPDRAGTGTNALSLPGRIAPTFGFHFGPDSFTAHGGEASRLGLDLRAIRSPTLALDIDLPGDLETLAVRESGRAPAGA